MSWFNLFRRRKSPLAENKDSELITTVDGRQFIADQSYLMPKDMGESNRLDFQHYMLRYALRGNYAAPIHNPQSILDVGTGTGRWATDLAQQFPAATVIGVDLVAPAVARGAAPLPRPENYTFVQGNVLERLPFADNSFDFVHARGLSIGIPAKKWPDVSAELLRVTRPGGWVEQMEAPPPQGAPALDQFLVWGAKMTGPRGIDLSVVANLGDFMAQAGAINLTRREIGLPVGKPAGRIGGMAAVDYLNALVAVRGLFAGAGIVDEATFEATLAQARHECDTGIYTQHIYLAFGQKA